MFSMPRLRLSVAAEHGFIRLRAFSLPKLAETPGRGIDEYFPVLVVGITRVHRFKPNYWIRRKFL